MKSTIIKWDIDERGYPKHEPHVLPIDELWKGTINFYKMRLGQILGHKNIEVTEIRMPGEHGTIEFRVESITDEQKGEIVRLVEMENATAQDWMSVRMVERAKETQGEGNA